MALPEQELQLAIVNTMAERERTPTSGMVNRQTAAVEIGDKAATDGLNYHQLRPLREQLERVFRRAFESLEKDRLIEPASGMNGTYGFLVLTPEGREAAKTPVNLDTACAIC